MLGATGQALAPVAAEALGRGSGLASLLSPLDAPRRSVANIMKQFGSGDIGNGIMSLLPLAVGAGASALGSPLLGSAIGAGLAQMGGEATGLDAFQAPDQAETADMLGISGTIPSVLANLLMDPLTYAGLPGAMRSASALKPSQAAVAAEMAGAGLKGGVPAAEALAGIDDAYRGVYTGLTETSDLARADQTMQGALRGFDDMTAAVAPQGQFRFGEGGIQGLNEEGSLQKLLQMSQDPRMPYVEYNPAIQQNLGELGQFSSLRAAKADQPAVSQFLEGSGQYVTPPNDRGQFSFPGTRPEALAGGRGGWTRVAGEIPQRPPELQLGTVPADMRRPDVLPSMSDWAMGTQGGQVMPQPLYPVQMSPVSANELYGMRRNLAGIGSGGQSVLDMPLDQAAALIKTEGAGSLSRLQEALSRVSMMTPEQQMMWAKMYPDLPLASLPLSV